MSREKKIDYSQERVRERKKERDLNREIKEIKSAIYQKKRRRSVSTFPFVIRARLSLQHWRESKTPASEFLVHHTSCWWKSFLCLPFFLATSLPYVPFPLFLFLFIAVPDSLYSLISSFCKTMFLTIIKRVLVSTNLNSHYNYYSNE